MSRNNYPPFGGRITTPTVYSSTAPKHAYFRTVDELVNFESFTQGWDLSTYDFNVAYGGSGVARSMRYVVNGELIETISSNGVAINSKLIENVVTVTASSTMSATTKMLRVNSANPTNQTLPAPTNGVQRIIKNRGAGLVTLIGTIDGATGVTLAQNKAIVIMGNGTDFDLVSVIS